MLSNTEASTRWWLSGTKDSPSERSNEEGPLAFVGTCQRADGHEGVLRKRAWRGRSQGGLQWLSVNSLWGCWACDGGWESEKWRGWIRGDEESWWGVSINKHGEHVWWLCELGGWADRLSRGGCWAEEKTLVLDRYGLKPDYPGNWL